MRGFRILFRKNTKIRLPPRRVSLIYIVFFLFLLPQTSDDMKKYFILMLLASLVTYSQAKPNITDVSFPTSAKLFDLYEIAFQLSNYANPYDPEVIDVYAEFTAPSGKSYKVNGFYFEGYRLELYDGYEKASADLKSKGWRIRFTPDQTGHWSFKLVAVDKKGKAELNTYQSKEFVFKCENKIAASGFISCANAQFLKRDVVIDGKRQYHSYFPIGPNVAWYYCKKYYDFSTPKGIFEYQDYIDNLSGNANFMRIWLSRYQYLSLYGPEFTQTVKGKPTVYFNSTLNQKDAAELDQIVAYAAQHNIDLMMSFFSFKEFCRKSADEESLKKNPGDWLNNPFHTQLGLKDPQDFFTDQKAKQITKNLIRYIAARWGYATNVMCWELWNEMENVDFDTKKAEPFTDDLVNWTNEMNSYLRSVDPYDHIVTTSIATQKTTPRLYDQIFKELDMAQKHCYYDMHKATPKEHCALRLLKTCNDRRQIFPNKPFFFGEYAFSQRLETSKYKDKDPLGIEIHNSLWGSMFSGAVGPASFYYWTVLQEQQIFSVFKPILVFSKNLPILSDSFIGYSTGNETQSTVTFPNGIETYYLMNAAKDTLLGWCQDTAFSYQSLRRLTEKVEGKAFTVSKVFDNKGYLYTHSADKKPCPSSKSNRIDLPLNDVPAGAAYRVRWYDSETGLELASEATKAVVDKHGNLPIEFPSSIRDIKNKNVSNTYGDAVFIITLDRHEKNAGSLLGKDAASKKQKSIRAKKGSKRQ